MQSVLPSARPSAADASVAPIAISMGNAAGIGAEIIAKSYATYGAINCVNDGAASGDSAVMRGTFVLGDVEAMRRAVQVCGLRTPVAELTSAAQALDCPPNCIPVLPVSGLDVLPDFGAVSAQAGAYSAACVAQGARMALRGEIAALATAPIHKEAWSAAGVTFPGHTEMLQALAAEHAGVPVDAMPVRMMLAASHLRVVLVTVHMGLRRALDTLSIDLIVQTIRIAHQSLTAMLGRAPRLAVAGVNPHAGEGGLFGSEEAEIIQPAVDAARAEGIDVSDPQPPDTVFMRASSAQGREPAFDAVVAMYHDQGLIPVKYLGTDDGVNVTLGLPLVRTSPDHGTAFDIAGSGKARADSLLLAVEQARRLSSQA